MIGNWPYQSSTMLFTSPAIRIIFLEGNDKIKYLGESWEFCKAQELVVFDVRTELF